MKVLVTGGSGFIGSATVKALQQAGHTVVTVDLQPAIHGEKYYCADVTDGPAMLDIFTTEQPQWVVHLAAHISVPASVEDPARDMQQNIAGSLSVFEASRKTGVKRVLFASSAAVYGDDPMPPIREDVEARPISPYGISKWSVEQYLQGFYRRWFTSVIFRYGNVYGPRQSAEGGAVIAKFLHGIAAEGRVSVHGDGSQQRDFIHVEDVAAANLLALEHSEPLLLNLGSGSPTSVNDLVQIFQDMNLKPFEVVYEPQRPGDIRTSYYDVTAVKRHLNWAPQVNLKDGLRALLESELSVAR